MFLYHIVKIMTSSIGSGYDLSASQFSPDGRVFQIEYACKAVENSGTAIGIKCKNGVVFAVENVITSRLYEPDTINRTFTIDRHIGMAACGLLSDSKELSKIARENAISLREFTGEQTSVKNLARRVALYVHVYTLYGMARPFGCSIMMASCEKDKQPQLYMIDPSGVCYGYEACALGKAQQAAETEIEKLKRSELTMTQMVKELARIIYAVHDEVKDKLFEIELSWVGEESNYKHEKVPKALFDEAVNYAQAALDDSDIEEA
ncbi:hypothetical protein GJ496_002495 [Pomphorhynchus laevis]|nr:hypothetical protein GJ496_002495 [Pomphorhynchus laevis]